MKLLRCSSDSKYLTRAPRLLWNVVTTVAIVLVFQTIIISLNQNDDNSHSFV
eukprot:JP442267.1.p2 GENE.JP442267.1~~JP442267.1.p2  ORF type:complete len:52 (-),score=4.77 JP442267.1:111-266(-)